eukprot:CAMPEP_0179321192 /NCGR_PEP_ID=MMETSP0797-20121207/58483_1 /TAXON_ID=47934 /ORGANISM="Dinophysis acuminata, Strain DAEP01" /LENGTH=300 /DNA_ID=CAMNT_0021032805 /DNA_START=44 /DNA_END=942 /DNA_ORIENTATION=+
MSLGCDSGERLGGNEVGKVLHHMLKSGCVRRTHLPVGASWEHSRPVLVRRRRIPLPGPRQVRVDGRGVALADLPGPHDVGVGVVEVYRALHLQGQSVASALRDAGSGHDLVAHHGLCEVPELLLVPLHEQLEPSVVLLLLRVVYLERAHAPAIHLVDRLLREVGPLGWLLLGLGAAGAQVGSPPARHIQLLAPLVALAVDLARRVPHEERAHGEAVQREGPLPVPHLLVLELEPRDHGGDLLRALGRVVERGRRVVGVAGELQDAHLDPGVPLVRLLGHPLGVAGGGHAHAQHGVEPYAR